MEIIIILHCVAYEGDKFIRMGVNAVYPYPHPYIWTRVKGRGNCIRLGISLYSYLYTGG